MKNVLVPQGTGYAANPTSTQTVNPLFLAFFNRAMGVGHAFYSGAPGQLQFKYALRPHPTESVTSLTIEYRRPGAELFRRERVVPTIYVARVRPGCHSYGEDCRWRSDLGFPSYSGTWGVFHFFADADKTVQNGSVYNVEWVLRVAGGRPVTAPNGKPVTVQFDLDTSRRPSHFAEGFLLHVAVCIECGESRHSLGRLRIVGDRRAA